MDPRQLELVQDSFARAIRFRPELTITFYSELFAIDPSLRSMFKGDLILQRQKLGDMLAQVIEGLETPETILPLVHDLAVRHVGYGVEERHYGMVGTALLRALKHELGPAFTPEVRAAWVSAYQWLTDEMLQAARNAPQAISR